MHSADTPWEEIGMNRRETLKPLGAPRLPAPPAEIRLRREPTMVTVVKIAGIPWFNAVEKGDQEGRQRTSTSTPRWSARPTSIRRSRSSCWKT